MIIDFMGASLENAPLSQSMSGILGWVEVYPSCLVTEGVLVEGWARLRILYN